MKERERENHGLTTVGGLSKIEIWRCHAGQDEVLQIF